MLLFPEYQPISPAVLDISLSGGGYPILVISNGRILSRNLRILGKNERWLSAELKKRGYSSPEQVFCMSLDREGRIFFAPLEDR